MNSGRVINILWLRKTEPWKSGTLSKAPNRANRANRGSRIGANRAAKISSSFPTDHSRKVAGPNSTKQKNHPGTGKSCKVVQGLVCGTGEQVEIRG